MLGNVSNKEFTKKMTVKLDHKILLLVLWVTFLATSNSSWAIASNYRLVGLGLHQETGRDIYLGGIYLNKETPRPESFESYSGPRIMEYRVVARRTSIRSLLGGMLLQSEIATGKAPGTATTEFADAVLSRVKSSLYAGDSLQIKLDDKGHTVASLNDHQLVSWPSAEIANYLLVGWVNENGPSTLFRNALMAEQADTVLLAKLESNNYSPERGEEIASWFGNTDTAEEVFEVVEVVEVTRNQQTPNLATTINAPARTRVSVHHPRNVSPTVVNRTVDSPSQTVHTSALTHSTRQEQTTTTEEPSIKRSIVNSTQNSTDRIQTSERQKATIYSPKHHYKNRSGPGRANEY